MNPHARDIVARVAGHVQDPTAVGLAARKLRRQEVTRRLARAVELILAHVQILGRPGVLQEVLAHAVLWASGLDEERPGPGYPHTTWWGLFCGAGEDRREEPGQEEMTKDIGSEMILMALFSKRGIFPSSSACVVEPTMNLVCHPEQEKAQMTDRMSKRPFGPSRFRKS